MQPQFGKAHGSQFLARRLLLLDSSCMLTTLPAFIADCSSYLAFDIGVRWCIERRMTVPYAFSAVDIPSKVILMFTELILLWAVSRPLQCVCIRLKIVGGWYGIYEVVLIPAFIVLAVLLAGERVASGYKMYRYAFMWNRPDPKWYAACLLAWVCALLWCSLVNLVAAIAAFSSYRSKRERIGFDRNLEPCGKASASSTA